MRQGRLVWGMVLALASATLVVLALAPGQAQTSRKMMNLQGRLTDTEGSPTTGTHLFELRIYDSGPAGSGNQLYYEAQIVEVNKGIYNVLVGDGYTSFSGDNPDNYAAAGGATGGIPASVFNRDNLWLEIEIDEDNPLDPRTRVVSAAYSFNADTLDGKDSSAFVELGGDASFADMQANTLSFTGGGDLDSTKVTGLTGGSETALHKHPASGARITRYYPHFYSPRYIRPYHNASFDNPEGTNPSGGSVSHRSSNFRSCWSEARYKQKITKYEAGTKLLIAWTFGYRVKEPHGNFDQNRTTGGDNHRNRMHCWFRMQLDGSWIGSEYSWPGSRPHRGGNYAWYVQGFAQANSAYGAVTAEVTGISAGDHNLSLHSCYRTEGFGNRGGYGCIVKGHAMHGNYIEVVEVAP